MIKINKKTWVLAFLIAILIATSFNVISACQSCDDANTEYSSQMVGTKNPAAVYCTELGYEYKIIKTEQGERGICVIPETGEEFDAWDFLEGKVGHDYSYCARIGYDTMTVTNGKNPFSSDYAVCIPKNSAVSSNESMSVTDLMNLEEKVSTSLSLVASLEAETFIDKKPAPSPSLPTSFDWRDVNGENWVTPVKNQGYCGSCWAFAAVGTVEAKANIIMNNSDFNLDLSEQYLVSNCCGLCGDCGGGYPTYALAYIMNYGITDEACYPYTASNSLCSDRCSLWDKRLLTIDGYGYISTQSASIKGALIDDGPLMLYMAINNGGYFDENGIYRGSTLPVNHGVLLVGYNDTGEYWIAKNSWGSGWNGDGYFKIGYGECYVTYWSPLFVTITENTRYNYPLPLPTPRPTSIPLPIPPEIPDPVPLPAVMTIPLPIPLPFFIPIPLPIPLP